MQHFIDHRVDVVRRRTAYLLAKAKEREHILEGYKTALDHLDNVITIIRGSANRAEARENLVAYFARQENRHQRHRPRAQARSRKAIHRDSGRRHPRTAIASSDPALHRRNHARNSDHVRESIAEFESILGVGEKSFAASSSKNWKK